LAAFDTFASRHLRADTFRLIAALRLVQVHAYRSADAVSVLDRVADGEWRNLARQEAARYLYNKPAEAAERWVALLSDVDLTAAPPFVDWNARSIVVSSARGEVGWQLAMNAWRQRVIAAGNYEHVMAFARAALMSPATGDLDAALDRASLLAPDADAVAAVVAMAAQTGKFDKARAALDGARVRFPNSPRLLRLASVVAEQSGDIRTAADLFTQAMKAEGDTPVALNQLRADYTRIISLYGQVAKVSGGPDRQSARDAAVAAGRDWRAIDPDYAPREQVLGELLIALGEDDEAWRYLSTPIDLAPREGASFMTAATVLERQNKLDQALGLWWRAYAIDATNPTWLQRAAQLELALGKKDKAKETLTKIAKGNWHSRYAGVKYWAENALRQ
jgi:tetratricopeptide (TPR) repeat protein